MVVFGKMGQSSYIKDMGMEVTEHRIQAASESTLAACRKLGTISRTYELHDGEPFKMTRGMRSERMILRQCNVYSKAKSKQ